MAIPENHPAIQEAMRKGLIQEAKPQRMAKEKPKRIRKGRKKQKRFEPLGDQVMQVWLTLPWPPSVNHLYFTAPNGMRLLNKAGKAYKESVIEIAKKVPCHVRGRLTLEVWAHVPDKRRRDLDNLRKIVLDSLQAAGVYEDDCMIDHDIMHRDNRCNGGKLVVCITGDMPR